MNIHTMEYYSAIEMENILIYIKYTDYITISINLKELCYVKETYPKGYILSNFTYRHSGKRKVVRTE